MKKNVANLELIMLPLPTVWFVFIIRISNSRITAGSVCVLLLQLHAVLTGDPGHVAAGVSGHQGILTWVLVDKNLLIIFERFTSIIKINFVIIEAIISLISAVIEAVNMKSSVTSFLHWQGSNKTVSVLIYRFFFCTWTASLVNTGSFYISSFFKST